MQMVPNEASLNGLQILYIHFFNLFKNILLRRLFYTKRFLLSVRKFQCTFVKQNAKKEPKVAVLP